MTPARRLLTAPLLLFAALMGLAVPALPHHAALADIFALLALASLLITRARPAFSLPLVGYLGWTALSAALHRSGGWALLAACELAAVWAAASTLDDWPRLLRAWSWGAVTLGVVALIVSSLSVVGIDTPWSSGGGELGWRFRPQGFTESTNLLASLCLVPLLFAVAQKRRAWTALLGVVLLLSASRTILAALVGVALLKKPRGGRWLVGALSLAAVISVVADVHELWWGPGIRWRIMASALRMALAHPLLGVGPGQHAAFTGWPSASDAALPWNAHSTPLDVAATLGIPALLALGALVVSALRKPGDAFLKVALWATLFDALTIDVERFRHVWLFLGLITAASRAAAPTSRSESTAPATPSPNARAATRRR